MEAILSAIEKKRSSDLTPEDLGAVKKIAGDLAGNPEIIDSGEEVLLQTVQGLHEKNTPSARLFEWALRANYLVINYLRQKQSGKYAVLLASDRCRILCRALLVFKPGNPEVLSYYAHSLALLGARFCC